MPEKPVFGRLNTIVVMAVARRGPRCIPFIIMTPTKTINNPKTNREAKGYSANKQRQLPTKTGGKKGYLSMVPNQRQR